LLQLLARLRNTANPPDAGDLRARATAEVRRFERRAREGGLPMEQLRPAHYALCASLDDVVLNTPWGISGGWADATLSSAFHHEAKAGERFFDLLAQLRQNPGPSLPAIELMYLCLSLGFMGRFRDAPRGAAEIDRLRAEVQATIAAARPPVEPALSPQWQGIDAPYRPARSRLPVWVVAAICLAMTGGVFAFVSTHLNASSDALYARTLSVPPAAMPTITRAALVLPPPPPPPSPEPTAVDRLRTALKPQIDQGAVTVLGTATTPVVRIASRVLFASNSATLQGSAAKLLESVATALRTEPGPIQAVGYTDNQPISTVQFPSNFQLSAARAQAVRTALARLLGDAKRVTSEGRADSDPVASNATPEGRDQNRRIDLVLHRQE
jgi:type VI secretion system protein ImpK